MPMSKDTSLAFRLSRAQRILVVAPHWVGDAVMTLGLLQALKTQDSGRDPPHISILCSKGVAAVYRASPVVSDVIEAPFAHGGLQFDLRRQMARQLKQLELPFTTAYILPNSFKTALIPFWAGILNRIGYGAEGRGLLLTKRWPKPSKTQKPAMLDWYGRLGNMPPPSRLTWKPTRRAAQCCWAGLKMWKCAMKLQVTYPRQCVLAFWCWPVKPVWMKPSR